MGLLYYYHIKWVCLRYNIFQKYDNSVNVHDDFVSFHNWTGNRYQCWNVKWNVMALITMMVWWSGHCDGVMALITMMVWWSGHCDGVGTTEASVSKQQPIGLTSGTVCSVTTNCPHHLYHYIITCVSLLKSGFQLFLKQIDITRHSHTVTIGKI